MTSTVQEPIGLTSVVSEIKKICARGSVYRKCGISPGHYLINLDAGNGQSTLTAYITDMFVKSDVRSFGGLDNYLEFKLDGTMVQMKQVFAEIRSCAVYTNDFEGVIAIDIAGLAAHINETQTALFLEEIKKISETATLVFFIPSVGSRNVSLLTSKLNVVINGLSVIQVNPYSSQELLEITMRLIEDAGVRLEDSKEAEYSLIDAMRVFDVENVATAKHLAEMVVAMTDAGSFSPILSSDRIAELLSGSEVKSEVRK